MNVHVYSLIRTIVICINLFVCVYIVTESIVKASQQECYVRED